MVAGGTAPFRVLLMGGVETRFHHFDEVGPALAGVIARGDSSLEVTSLPAPEALHSEVLRGHDALVSITTGGELTAAQELALSTAIAEPKNDRARPLHFLGVHGASCSFSNSPPYQRLLGGRFLRHPPMATFRVQAEAPAHPVTSGIDAFDICDELYVLELLAEVRVLLSAPNPEALPGAPRLPLGWVRKHGQGHVCYLALGHGREQLEHPSVARLVHQALAWFASS